MTGKADFYISSTYEADNHRWVLVITTNRSDEWD